MHCTILTQFQLGFINLINFIIGSCTGLGAKKKKNLPRIRSNYQSMVRNESKNRKKIVLLYYTLDIYFCVTYNLLEKHLINDCLLFKTFVFDLILINIFLIYFFFFNYCFEVTADIIVRSRIYISDTCADIEMV